MHLGAAYQNIQRASWPTPYSLAPRSSKLNYSHAPRSSISKYSESFMANPIFPCT